LEALYPGRIDLGVGRAPGGDARTAQAVGGGQFPDAERFPQQVWELVAHLDGHLPPEHPFRRVRLQPEVTTAPEVWLLGSSDYSGALAAQLGLPFSFAHFRAAAKKSRASIAKTSNRVEKRSRGPWSARSPSAARTTTTPSGSRLRSTCAACTWR
jgi:alkanesulfonate monooxygenase SsuD/methylene tetrahydromethanopterin reductase-like flavin-dependent oxidoreductase (luciferase family)